MRTLYVMMGIPASGKSTFIQKNYNPETDIIVSRDKIRFEFLELEDPYFSKEEEVYKRFIYEINEGLINNKNVFADQTTLNKKARTKLFNALKVKPYQIAIIYMDTPLEIALERNAQRTGRERVPDESIINMYNSIDFPTASEPINYILKVNEKGEQNITYFLNKASEPKFWFTSDWHFGHDKDFLYEPRGFNNIIDHDKELIRKHNELVSPNDDVYVLGDLTLGDTQYGLDCISKMNGKLHIIRGNHDTDSRVNMYEHLKNVVEICEAKTIKIHKQYYFLCHYPALTANYDDKPYHNHLINLFGHTHQQENFYNNNPFMYHVGIDSHNNAPISIEEIEADIHKKINELYQKKQEQERIRKECQEGLDIIMQALIDQAEADEYFDNHPTCGPEILD